MILICKPPSGDAKPRAEITLSKGLKIMASSGIERVRISAGRKSIPWDFSSSSWKALEGEGEERVEGRRRTVIFVEGLLVVVRVWREWRIAVPSSPRPNRRMDFGDGILCGKSWAVMGSCDGILKR